MQSSAPEVASHFKSLIRLFFLMALYRLAGIRIRPGRAHLPRKRRDFRLTRDGDTYVVSVGLEEYDGAGLTTCTYKQRRAYPSVAAGLTLGANSSAHTWWRGLTTCTILCAGCCLRVQFESVGLSLLVALASMARNWVWPGRTCFPSTSFAPHCGGWKFFF